MERVGKEKKQIKDKGTDKEGGRKGGYENGRY